MKRLTERLINEQAAIVGCGYDCNYEYDYCDELEHCPKICEVTEKLARYEDTMLTPEEIMELKEKIEYYDRLESALYKVFGEGEKLVEVAVRTLLNDPCYDERIMIPDLDSWVKMYGDKSLMEDGTPEK